MREVFKLHKKETYLRLIIGSLFFYILTSSILLWPRLKPIFSGDLLTFVTKVSVFSSSLFSFTDIYTPVTGLVTLINALLFGIVTQLLWTKFKSNRTQAVTVLGKSAAATLLATIGAGCAACGTLIIGPLLASIGATGLITALPGHGIEFALIGTALLVYSIYDLYKKVSAPLVCTV